MKTGSTEGGILFSLKSHVVNEAMKNAELAVRAARDAVATLEDHQREFIAIAVQAQEEEVNGVARRDRLFESVERAKQKLPRLLPVLAEALARICGTNPRRRPRPGSKGRRGRPKGAVGDFPFNQFVQSFWELVRRYDGELTLTTKDGIIKSGTLVTVLELLRPTALPGSAHLLPPDLIPARLSAKVLEEIRKRLVPF